MYPFLAVSESTQLPQSSHGVSVSAHMHCQPQRTCVRLPEEPLKPLSRSLRVNVYNLNIPTPSPMEELATHTTILSRSFS